MPYYKDIHTLFIHIPKTGGTTLEKVLRQEGNNKQSLYSGYTNKLLPEPYNKISLQHQFYQTILENKNLCNIDFDEELKLLTIVRNPYHRAVSSLFFYNQIQTTTPPPKVFEALRKFIEKSCDQTDNHNVPQYEFITDKNGKLPNKLIVLKTESLDRDMLLYFKRPVYKRELVGNEKRINYMKYLGPKSIELINQVYEKDFKLLGYSMKKITS